MKISIIIPAWHEEKIIIPTLDSLKKSNYNLKDCEVIVIASSDDNTYNLAKKQDMHSFKKYLVIKQKPGGKNTALQQGIRASRGGFIILLDADTVADRNWLAEIIKPIEFGNYACSNGNCFSFLFPLVKSWLNNYLIIENIWIREVLNQPLTNGAGGIAFKRELIEEIGIDRLFNKRIYKGIDRDFGEQILKRGYEIYFAKKAIIRTLFNKNLVGFIKTDLRWKKGFFNQISKKRAITIVCFNIFLIFFSGFIPYALIKLFCSAFKSKKYSLLSYFPTYLFLTFLGCLITIKAACSNKKQEIHFKGERTQII